MPSLYGEANTKINRKRNRQAFIRLVLADYNIFVVAFCMLIILGVLQ